MDKLINVWPELAELAAASRISKTLTQDSNRLSTVDSQMINRKGEDYKDELDLAEEELELALERFAIALAKASYTEGVDDVLDQFGNDLTGFVGDKEDLRKELLDE